MRILTSTVLILTLASCGGGTADAPADPAVNPVPQISSVVPDTALAGSASATIAVNGTGFVSSSVVIIANLGVATTRRSATQLTAVLDSALLATTGTRTVRVSNPAPGGGQSATFSIDVRNPLPKITSMTPTSIEAGTLTPTLHVNGTGFVTNSVVFVGGAARPTTRLSVTQLSLELTNDDIKQAGTAAISVVNPTPGGGTSATSQLPVVLAQPILSRLPVTGGAAGRAGFSLAADGQRFATTSVVTWNGSDRPTTYISGSRLTAAISAADVASAGVAQIAVRNPGIAPSAALSFSVRALASATLTNFTIVHLPTQDVVYDPRTDRLYATVAPDGAPYGNCVIAIDPQTGQVTGSVFVGPDPQRIVLSDDGKYLYVTLNSNADVRRVQVSPLAAQLQFTPLTGVASRVGDFAVLPGNSRALAVVRTASGYSKDVLIYDDDQPRPKTVRADYPTTDVIAFGPDASTLYGANVSTTAHDFRTLAVDASGVSSVKGTAGIPANYSGRYIMYAGGRIYYSLGAVVDPERHVSLGQIEQFPPAPMVVDVSLGRAYFVDPPELRVYDLNNYQLLATLAVPDSIGSSGFFDRRPQRWGSDGFVFTDGVALYILRAGLIGP